MTGVNDTWFEVDTMMNHYYCIVLLPNFDAEMQTSRQLPICCYSDWENVFDASMSYVSDRDSEIVTDSCWWMVPNYDLDHDFGSP